MHSLTRETGEAKRIVLLLINVNENLQYRRRTCVTVCNAMTVKETDRSREDEHEDIDD